MREMSEGELLQLEKARDLNFSEAVYFDIIRQKTASLIAACCASGPMRRCHPRGGGAHAPLRRAHRHRLPDRKDDLFDYGNGATPASPAGWTSRKRS